MDHSLVYYDSLTEEVVIMGGQSSSVGTYTIVVSASIKSATQYVCSSFEFELEVVDELSTGTTEDTNSSETVAECNKSQVVLEDL